SLRDWLSLRWGLDYVSRNAMIVGVAMGFAVIPAIYSIADDAIFTVPRHLSYGALALGANGWQTMAWLILPAAAPGILSALMIGFGRALGETMIVLMATGNTPIMDMNLFEGMRTLAANLAIEIPESEVGSTHYRILFLASLVLLLFTFVINTIAELVRQRLRKRYRTI
ncbi:MAG: ABC transporter permease subunit, partial [Gammaproteobacteria bacterium]|nr:ABC transporter permease subunit [Gammaproteobacteria bacterium]